MSSKTGCLSPISVLECIMLSEKQIEFYHQQGYLGVENVFSSAEIAELRRITDEFVEKSRGVAKSGEVFDVEPSHTRELPRLRRLKEPVKQHPVYRQALRHPAVLDIVAQLI